MNISRANLVSLLFVGIVALGSAASIQAQSGNFTVSQNGHSVGTASYRFASQAGGVDSTSVVRVSMKGLNYALSKNDQLDQADRLQHVQLSATINNSAVNVTGRPDGAQFLLNISANGRSTTTRLTAHADAVFLPDFDPGALQMLLTLGVTKNRHDLWAVIPKEAGSVKSVQLATYPDEHGTFNGQPVTVHHVVATIGNTQTHLFTSASNELLQAELPQEGFALVQSGFKLTPPKKPMAAPPAQ